MADTVFVHLVEGPLLGQWLRDALVPVSALLVVLVGWIGQWWFSKRQFEEQRALSSASFRSNARIQWTSQLRTHVAEFVALINEIRELSLNRGPKEEAPSFRARLVGLRMRGQQIAAEIRLLLDTTKPDQAKIVSELAEVVHLINPEQPTGISDEQWSVRIIGLEDATRHTLDLHWEKAKAGR